MLNILIMDHVYKCVTQAITAEPILGLQLASISNFFLLFNYITLVYNFNTLNEILRREESLLPAWVTAEIYLWHFGLGLYLLVIVNFLL